MPSSLSQLARYSHLWIGGLLAVCALIGGWAFTGFVTQTGERLEQSRFQALAVTAAASLDPAVVAALRASPNETGTPDFERVRAGLKRVHLANPDLRFVYLMRPKLDKPDRMVFLADAEPVDSPDYSAPGDEYDGPSATLFGVYDSGRPTIEAPTRDRWGYWITSMAAVRDASSGATVAVLGMDINAESWLANIARYRAFALTISGLALALVLLFTLGLHLQKLSGARIEVINTRLARQVTELERAQRELRLADIVVKNMGEGIVVLDRDFLVETANPGFEQITGFSAEEVVGKVPQMLSTEDGAQDILQTIRSGLQDSDQWEGMLWARRKNGEFYPMETSIDVVRDAAGAVQHDVMIIRDVTARTQLEEHLRGLSATDGLTGLANRRAFDEALDREWRRAVRDSVPLSLIMADIDLFKSYNDTYGHLEGDQCLRQVAATIAECAKRGGDFVARYGGEEFAVILPQTDANAARLIAERIRKGVEALGIAHAGNAISGHVTISLGVGTLTPPHVEESLSLIQSADKALYRAKNSGRNAVAA